MPRTARKQTKPLNDTDIANTNPIDQRIEHTSVDFSPVLGRERKPWNPQWFVYEYMTSHFVSPQQQVLDYQCGQGISSLRLARIGYDVCGVSDHCSDLHLARGLARRYHLAKNCCFRTMDLAALNIPDESIDFVVAFDLFEIDHLQQSISEIHRVLKPEGTALFKGQVDENLFDLSGCLTLGSDCSNQHHPTDQHPTEYPRQLDQHHLAVIEGLFTRVEQESFTILNRIGRFGSACDQRMLDRLQQLDHRLHIACPALADLGNTVVLICQK